MMRKYHMNRNSTSSLLESKETDIINMASSQIRHQEERLQHTLPLMAKHCRQSLAENHSNYNYCSTTYKSNTPQTYKQTIDFSSHMLINT